MQSLLCMTALDHTQNLVFLDEKSLKLIYVNSYHGFQNQKTWIKIAVLKDMNVEMSYLCLIIISIFMII